MKRLPRGARAALRALKFWRAHFPWGGAGVPAPSDALLEALCCAAVRDGPGRQWCVLTHALSCLAKFPEVRATEGAVAVQRATGMRRETEVVV